MSKWLIMKIPGTTKVQLSLLTILAISSVTSTSLLITQQAKSTSVENISCRRGNQEVENVELPQSLIGKNITDRVRNSRQMLKSMEN